MAAGQAGSRERPRPEQGRHGGGRRDQVQPHRRAPLELEPRRRLHGGAVRHRRRGRERDEALLRRRHLRLRRHAAHPPALRAGRRDPPDRRPLHHGSKGSRGRARAARHQALRPLPLRHLPAASGTPASCGSWRRMSRWTSWSRAIRSLYEGALVGRKRPARARARGRGRPRRAGRRGARGRGSRRRAAHRRGVRGRDARSSCAPRRPKRCGRRSRGPRWRRCSYPRSGATCSSST